MTTVDNKVRGFCWVDIETTGLDFEDDQILEIACIFTDFHLNHLSDFHIYQDYSVFATVDPFVVQMHEDTGLWKILQGIKENEGLPTKQEVDQVLTDWIRNLKSVYNLTNIEMAGSSVGQFDKRFVSRDYPTFHKELSYRVLDVTSLKTISEMCGSIVEDEKNYQPEHVARNDVKNSLMYARKFFNPFVEVSTHAEHLKKLM